MGQTGFECFIKGSIHVCDFWAVFALWKKHYTLITPREIPGKACSRETLILAIIRNCVCEGKGRETTSLLPVYVGREGERSQKLGYSSNIFGKNGSSPVFMSFPAALPALESSNCFCAAGIYSRAGHILLARLRSFRCLSGDLGGIFMWPLKHQLKLCSPWQLRSLMLALHWRMMRICRIRVVPALLKNK